MPRRAANVLTLVSAVVCVLSLLLVGRSWFRADSVAGAHSATTIDGHVIILTWNPARPGPVTYESHAAARFRDVRETLLKHREWAMRWLRIGRVEFMKGLSVVILPFWPVPLLTAIPPVRWWWKRRRERGRGFAVMPVAATESD